MKKKIVIPLIFVSIFFLGAAITGYAHWWVRNCKKGSVDDFVIKETPEGKIVENKREKLTFKIPDGWKIEKDSLGYEPGTEEEWRVNLYSPDIEYIDFPHPIPADQLPPMFKKGCYFSVGFETLEGEVEGTYFNIETYKKFGDPPKKPLEWAEERIADEKGNMVYTPITIVEVKNRLGEKGIISNHPQAGFMFELRFPINKFKNLVFQFSSPLSEKEKCLEEFKKLLENASI